MSKKLTRTLVTLSSLILLHLTLLFISSNILPTSELIRESLSQQMSGERITKYLEFQSDWGWLSYVITGVVVLLRIGLIVLCFKIGTLLYNFKIRNYLPIIIASELSLICMNIFSLCWFWLNKENLTLEFIGSFTPLAISNLFDLSLIEQVFYYPLRIINAFEVSFWFVLTVLISREIKLNFWKSFEFVMSTYGLGLVIWVVFTMFLTVNS